jgi:site-specific DNA-methyltransferase (adenine-specific)
MGTGTTALACKQLGRNYIGFDLQQDYIDIANKRIGEYVESY